MKEKRKGSRTNQGISLLLSIIIVFCILGAFVFAVSRKISREMSESAVQNLNESLDLIKSTIEAILKKEAEFQKLMAQEAAAAKDPREYVLSIEDSQTMARISLISSGEKEGISHKGEVFTEEGLDFSAGGTVDGLPISQSYLNHMGTWAYTIKCPVEKEGRERGTLYVEYVYDTLDQSLPEGFYNGRAMLYVMDSNSERLVLKPTGMGERSAGHLDLKDFYRANNIQEPGLQEEVAQCLEQGRKLMFYHDIRGKSALNYMWPVNGGTVYLIGYVPVEAIQQEGRTVNHNIYIVVFVMLVAFFLCCLIYFLNQRQQERSRREREAEREIHNQHLAEALQAAQVASSSKTTFLSNMSHDIRTPMNAVLGFAALLSREAENPDKVRDYTRKIMASGQHLLGLINDILDVSKIESGKMVLSLEEFSLSGLVSSVDAMIRPMAEGKRQNFHVEVTGIRHEYMMGDETRLSRILINLLSNGVKYTQEGGDIWLRIIGLKQRPSQFERLRIEVEDNGYGMTPEYLKVIFDAFTRAENSTTNKVQGTGLGMAITKNIVELMGGSIDVFSEVGKGSLFRVELECRIPESRTDRQFWMKCGVSRILAVAQDAGVRRDIEVRLMDAGVVVDTASSVEEAAALVQEKGRKEENYQVLLMDWELPGMNGIQGAELLREKMGAMVPVLFLKDGNGEAVEEAARMERAGVLSRPFFVSAFQEKILEMQAGEGGKTVAQAAESGNLEGLHFLAAEDNEINAEILREILAVEGADCVLVENGQMALERFRDAREGEFDAILMDVQMPVMNGYDATRAIRALERRDAGQIPIIAMTANAFAEDEKEALAAGMNVHLAKPINIELLKEVIVQYLNRG